MKERVDAEDAALSIDSLLRDLRYALRGFAKSSRLRRRRHPHPRARHRRKHRCLSAPRCCPTAKPAHPGPAAAGKLRIVGGHRGFGITTGPYAEFTVPCGEVRRHHDPFPAFSPRRPPTSSWVRPATLNASTPWKLVEIFSMFSVSLPGADGSFNLRMKPIVRFPKSSPASVTGKRRWAARPLLPIPPSWLPATRCRS